MIDGPLISYAVRQPNGLTQLLQHGVEKEDFVGDYQSVWLYLMRMRQEHNATPSPEVLQMRFPDIDLPRVQTRDLPPLLSSLRNRRKYTELIRCLADTTQNATDYERVDELVESLQSKVNEIAFRDNRSAHLRDVFSRAVSKEILAAHEDRRRGRTLGIPTGLPRFDEVTGGMQRQKMITVIGRPGQGKSWIDLLFVSSAVRMGAKVLLYPLEMTLQETVARLITIFSAQMSGNRQTIRNYDLTHGRVDRRTLIRTLKMLEERFAGRLLIADVGSLSDKYSTERIEAEVEAHKPDMFWVDYITLMKRPRGQQPWESVQALSNGIKNIAMRRNVIGGCTAQVSREHTKASSDKFDIPRLEHIAYGDSIGQDADLVMSIAKIRQHLFYGLVKHRGGPEIARQKIKFDPDRGVFQELTDPDEEE